MAWFQLGQELGKFKDLGEFLDSKGNVSTMDQDPVVGQNINLVSFNQHHLEVSKQL